MVMQCNLLLHRLQELNMKKIMIIGRTSCGKTTFSQALNHIPLKYKKTQTIEVINNTIDTPGEYIENRRLYRALIVTSAEAEAVVMMQDCTVSECIFPTSFSAIFNGKPVIGIVSKIDSAKDEEQILWAERMLKLAGAKHIFMISSVKGIGIEAVKEYLSNL